MNHYFSDTRTSVAWLICGLVMVSLSAGRPLASADASLQQHCPVEEFLPAILVLQLRCKVRGFLWQKDSLPKLCGVNY